MKKITLLTLSLLYVFNSAYGIDENQNSIGDEKTGVIHTKAQAQKYLELIRLPNSAFCLKEELGEFLFTRCVNAETCLLTNEWTRAHKDETAYSNWACLMKKEDVEADPKKRIFYYYETLLKEYCDSAIRIQKAERTTQDSEEQWKKRDAIEFTAKRDFAQAVLDLLSQQNTQEAQ